MLRDPLPGQKLILLVAGSPSSLELLHDVLALFGSDTRIAISATTSPYVQGEAATALERALTEADLPFLPWQDVAYRSVDLVLTTQDEVVPHFAVPVVVLTTDHLIPADSPQVRVRAFHTGSQKGEASDDLVVDPGWERMVAATGRRDRYRDALGTNARRLVVMCSNLDRTTFIRQRDTIQGLLGFLPVDEYKVAVVAHPSLWWSPRDDFLTGAGDISLVMSGLVEAGVAVIPPHGRRAAMIAADVVLGEPVSTRYATALGTPTSRLDPPTPTRRYQEALSWDLVDAIATARPPTPAPPMKEMDGAPRLRSLFYRCLNTPKPTTDTYYQPLPDLPEDRHEATAWRITGSSSPDGAVSRYPAGAPPLNPARFPLVVDVEDGDLLRQQNAAGWCCRGGLLLWEARAWAAYTFTKHPMARVVACEVDGGGVLVVHRNGPDDGVLIPHTGETAQVDASMVAANALIDATSAGVPPDVPPQEGPR
ncbi:hypothetical protein GCM10027590_27970 [Nocardiopsis nanhaiensis]